MTWYCVDDDDGVVVAVVIPGAARERHALAGGADRGLRFAPAPVAPWLAFLLRCCGVDDAGEATD